jgi:hypothetical protein
VSAEAGAPREGERPLNVGDDSRGMNEPRRGEGAPTETWEALRAAVARAARAVLQRASTLLAHIHMLELLTVAALAGGVLMVIGEFLTLFEVKSGTVVIASPTSGDHHSYALLMVGAATLAAVLLARSGAGWAPAAAAAALGVLALAILLIGDLPDATSSGFTAERKVAEAEPRAGFWMLLAGASTTLGSGIALTYLLRR